MKSHNWSAKGWRGLTASTRWYCLPPCLLDPCCPHGMYPAIFMLSARLLAKIPRRMGRKPLHSSSYHLSSPRDPEPPAALVPGQVCRDSQGEQPVICRGLHPFLKQPWYRTKSGAKSTKLVGILLSGEIPSSQSSAMRWEHLWQLFVNSFMPLSLSTVW